MSLLDKFKKSESEPIPEVKLKSIPKEESISIPKKQPKVQESSRKQRGITFKRIEEILADTKDHTNKYLRNVILKFEEWRLAPLIPGLSIKVEQEK